MNERIAELWDRIAAWHHRYAPAMDFRLPPGAPEQALAELERRVGAPLPEDIRASLALHDGLDGRWLLTYGEVLSVRQIVETWEHYAALESTGTWGRGDAWRPRYTIAGVKAEWWSPLRVPITHDGGLDHVLVDLDPGAGGRYGQVLFHDRGMGVERVLASGFEAWLSRIAEELEGGQHVYDEFEEAVMPVGGGAAPGTAAYSPL